MASSPEIIIISHIDKFNKELKDIETKEAIDHLKLDEISDYIKLNHAESFDTIKINAYHLDITNYYKHYAQKIEIELVKCDTLLSHISEFMKLINRDAPHSFIEDEDKPRNCTGFRFKLHFRDIAQPRTWFFSRIQNIPSEDRLRLFTFPKEILRNHVEKMLNWPTTIPRINVCVKDHINLCNENKSAFLRLELLKKNRSVENIPYVYKIIKHPDSNFFAGVFLTKYEDINSIVDTFVECMYNSYIGFSKKLYGMLYFEEDQVVTIENMDMEMQIRVLDLI